MNTSRFAELGRHSRAPGNAKASPHADANTAPEDQTDDQDEPKPGKKPDDTKEKAMADQVDTNSADYLAGQKAGETNTKAAERTRTTSVLASEHFAGREMLAGKMLATELSAEDIIGMLAATPVAGQSAAETNKADDEEELSQGREMLDNMKQQGNANLGNKGGEDETTTRKAKASAKLDRAWARTDGKEG